MTAERPEIEPERTASSEIIRPRELAERPGRLLAHRRDRPDRRRRRRPLPRRPDRRGAVPPERHQHRRPVHRRPRLRPHRERARGGRGHHRRVPGAVRQRPERRREHGPADGRASRSGRGARTSAPARRATSTSAGACSARRTTRTCWPSTPSRSGAATAARACSRAPSAWASAARTGSTRLRTACRRPKSRTPSGSRPARRSTPSTTTAGTRQFDLTVGGPISDRVRAFVGGRFADEWYALPTNDPERTRQVLGSALVNVADGMSLRTGGGLQQPSADTTSRRRSGSTSGTASAGSPRSSASTAGGSARFSYAPDARRFVDVNVSVLRTDYTSGAAILSEDRFREDASDLGVWRFFNTPDQFRVGYPENDFRDERSTTYALDGSYNDQVTNNHLVKGGVQTRLHHLEVDNRLNLSSPSDAEDESYTVYPFEIGAFVEDKIEYERPDRPARPALRRLQPQHGLLHRPLRPVRQPRLRPDAAGRRATTRVRDPDLAALDRTPWIARLQPRLGASFPISVNTVFHLNYGSFLQRPPFERSLVSRVQRSNAVAIIQLGNPTLEPEETRMYEVGVAQGLPLGFSLDVSGYYKDVRNLVQLALFSEGVDIPYQTLHQPRLRRHPRLPRLARAPPWGRPRLAPLPLRGRHRQDVGGDRRAAPDHPRPRRRGQRAPRRDRPERHPARLRPDAQLRRPAHGHVAARPRPRRAGRPAARTVDRLRADPRPQRPALHVVRERARRPGLRRPRADRVRDEPEGDPAGPVRRRRRGRPVRRGLEPVQPARPSTTTASSATTKNLRAYDFAVNPSDQTPAGFTNDPDEALALYLGDSFPYAANQVFRIYGNMPRSFFLGVSVDL